MGVPFLPMPQILTTPTVPQRPHRPQGFTLRKTEAPLQMEGIENWGVRELRAPWTEVPADWPWRPIPFEIKSGHHKEQLSRLSLWNGRIQAQAKDRGRRTHGHVTTVPLGPADPGTWQMQTGLTQSPARPWQSGSHVSGSWRHSCPVPESPERIHRDPGEPRAWEMGAAAICPVARSMSPETVLWEATTIPHIVTVPFGYGTEWLGPEPEEGHSLGATAASELCESDHGGQRRILTPYSIDEIETLEKGGGECHVTCLTEEWQLTHHKYLLPSSADLGTRQDRKNFLMVQTNVAAAQSPGAWGWGDTGQRAQACLDSTGHSMVSPLNGQATRDSGTRSRQAVAVV